MAAQAQPAWVIDNNGRLKGTKNGWRHLLGLTKDTQHCLAHSSTATASSCTNMVASSSGTTFEKLVKSAFPLAAADARLWNLTGDCLCPSHACMVSIRCQVYQNWHLQIWRQYLRAYGIAATVLLPAPPPIHLTHVHPAALWREVAEALRAVAFTTAPSGQDNAFVTASELSTTTTSVPSPPPRRFTAIRTTKRLIRKVVIPPQTPKSPSQRPGLRRNSELAWENPAHAPPQRPPPPGRGSQIEESSTFEPADVLSSPDSGVADFFGTPRVRSPEAPESPFTPPDDTAPPVSRDQYPFERITSGRDRLTRRGHDERDASPCPPLRFRTRPKPRDADDVQTASSTEYRSQGCQTDVLQEACCQHACEGGNNDNIIKLDPLPSLTLYYQGYRSESEIAERQKQWQDGNLLCYIMEKRWVQHGKTLPDTKEVEGFKGVTHYITFTEMKKSPAPPLGDLLRLLSRRLGRYPDASDRLRPGSVYGFARADHSGYIKIGKGLEDPHQRLKEPQRCGYEPKVLFVAAMPCAPDRMEKLIHFELRDRKRLAQCYTTTCKKKHREWFEVGLEEALEVVTKWQQFSLCEPYTQSGTLKPVWLAEVNALQKDCTSRRKRKEEPMGVLDGWHPVMKSTVARLVGRAVEQPVFTAFCDTYHVEDMKEEKPQVFSFVGGGEPANIG